MKDQMVSTKPSLFGWFFSSPSDQRLRAGWRILITLLALVVFLSGNVLLARMLPDLPPFVTVLLQSLIATILVFLARVWIDRRSIASLGVTLTWRAALDVTFGMLVMGMAYALIYLLLMQAGWLQPHAVNWSSAAWATIAGGLLLGLLSKAFGAWWEELVFRGYLLQNVKDGLSLFWAVVLPSFVFGIAHLTNPNATLAGAAGVATAGLLLGFAYVRTRQLWLPLGIHIGNNFFQGVVFGFPVSGLVGSFHLLQPTVSGLALITGGAFGPEAGLVILPFLFLSAAAVYYYTRRPVEI